MKFGQAIAAFFSKYAAFTGRARRSEFWFAVLFTGLVNTGLGIINPGPVDANGVQHYGVLQNLWGVAIFIPTLAVITRGLHDTNSSPANLCWLLLPIVGWIILIVRLAQDSQPGTNQYGEPVK